jgi:hypothetical protein
MRARTTTAPAITLPTITDVQDDAIRLDGIARRTPVLQDDLLDAAALAAVLTHAQFRNRRIAILASGGNLDPALLQHALVNRTASSWKKRASG